MNTFSPLCSVLVLLCWSAFVAGEEYKLAPLDEAPADLSSEVAAQINPQGFRVSAGDKVTCDLWLVKEAKLKPKFKPTQQVKYPFMPGELVGAVRFPEVQDVNDFRGQKIAAGTYTLRYGQQPNDGNHLGTSEIRDFLLACPPKVDQTPARVEMVKELFKLSAEAAGTAHPAIFLLSPPREEPKAPAVVTDEEKKQVLVGVSVPAKEGEKTVQVQLLIVVVGKSEG